MNTEAKTMTDFLFVTLPKIKLEVPPLGSAIVQAIAQAEGYSTNFIDMNLHTQIKGVTLDGIQKYYTDRMHKFNGYKFICLSLFSRESIPYCCELVKLLRVHHPAAKIIIGGGGVQGKYEDTFFGNYCLTNDLIDYYVYGDGEIAFTNILRDNLPCDGVNNTSINVVQQMDETLYPSFDNFDLPAYAEFGGRNRITLEGSRGCVRNCTFCNIKSQFKTYRYKSGRRIFDEMVNNAEKYNIYEYWFNDSLINGANKQFRELCELLSVYNKTADHKLTFSGQYIIRPQRQNPEEDFKLMSEAGVLTLAIGLESYSESVRDHMKKKFNNDDIRYFFKMCQRYDISIFILMIVGYPTETEEDHDMNKKFFREFKNYALDQTVHSVMLGGTMSILENTQVADMAEQIGMMFQETTQERIGSSWYTDEISIKRRYERRLELEQVATENGFITDGDHIYDYIHSALKGLK